MTVPSPARGPNGERLRYDLLPPLGLREVAHAATVGATKHPGEPGLEFPLCDQYAAVQRHLLAWLAGEDVDPDDGQSHLGAAGLRLLQMAEIAAVRPELDDRRRR